MGLSLQLRSAVLNRRVMWDWSRLRGDVTEKLHELGGSRFPPVRFRRRLHSSPDRLPEQVGARHDDCCSGAHRFRVRQQSRALVSGHDGVPPREFRSEVQSTKDRSTHGLRLPESP